MSKQNMSDRPTEDPYTCSTTDIQKFTDSGAPLEEGLKRPRRGMPDYNSNQPKPNENDSPPKSTS